MSAARKKQPKRNGSWLAIILIFFGLLIPIFTFMPVFKAEIGYEYLRITKSNNSPLPTPTPVDLDFSIQIPKININTKVVKNVDPFDSKKYQIALTKGVAHALGSATPDKLGNVFIFAHSAQDWYQANQYNAIFYLINKLSKDDEIILYYQGKPYTYIVSKVTQVDSTAVEYINGDKTSDTLQLMTCWPPGTSLKRMIITANKKS